MMVFTEKMGSYIESHTFIQSYIHLMLFIEHLLFARHPSRCWEASSQQNHRTANSLMAGTQLTGSVPCRASPQVMHSEGAQQIRAGEECRVILRKQRAVPIELTPTATGEVS